MPSKMLLYSLAKVTFFVADESICLFPIGRRGLLNLGQTCFLNVVLQSFIHNPLLRNYFLGDRHNSRLCKHTDCTCCEMDNLFTEVSHNMH